MQSNLSKSILSTAALAVFGLAFAAGQTRDTTGNGLLNGSFRFRHVAVQNVDVNHDPTQITATFGTITFDGAGNYTVTGTTVDNTVSAGAPRTLNVTGTYAIGSNGTGYLSNPLYPASSNDYIYGAVSQGVYTGSSTEAGFGHVLNDIFIAIPAGTPPTNASFTASYQTGLLDFTGAGSTAIKNALFMMTPTGQGGFNTMVLKGQASNQSAAVVTESIAGSTYNFNSDGSATLNIPLPTGFNAVSAANALFVGSKTMFVSADGNFILGWTAAGYDLFFGVKVLTVPGSNSLSKGLYYTAALEDSLGSTGTGAYSYYGSISNSGDAKGDSIVNARLNSPAAASFDYGINDQINVNADGTTGTSLNGYQYIFGDGGMAFVGIGTQGNFSLIVGMHAPAFSGPGVYLNPIGVVNAASYQPITASLAPGELIALFGTGLSPVTMTMQGGQTFPATLGGVSVTIDNFPCPIYYVSATQMSVIVPYEVASNQSGLANIQVNNNGVLSNVVQMRLGDSAPAAFSNSQNGIGTAAARHAATGLPLTSANPAVPGEYISLYLTGLGAVTPPITDGALGPVSPFSISNIFTANSLEVYFNGIAGSIQYAGLAPELAGLYQINVMVPATGGMGNLVYVEFVTDSADVNQIEIPYNGNPSN